MMETKMADAAETASGPVLEIAGARATIRLNRPKHLNRLQAEDLGDLVRLFDRIEADPAIRVLVLTGTGRAFSAGYDLNSVAERAVSTVEQRSAGSAFEVVVNRLEDIGLPTICRLNGGVYGGSTDLALACDFRIGVGGEPVDRDDRRGDLGDDVVYSIYHVSFLNVADRFQFLDNSVFRAYFRVYQDKCHGHCVSLKLTRGSFGLKALSLIEREH